MSQTARRTTRAAAAAVVLVVGLTLTAASCSGDGDSKPKGAPSSSATPAGVTTQVSVGKLTGALPVGTRSALTADVQKVVDGWIDAAYVGGTYPRTDFTGSWPGFTPGAAALAKRDAALMSNADIGGQIDGVDVTSRVVKLDVVSHQDRPVGVTANVLVTFTTTGPVAEDVRVAGRLYLTPANDGWHVFGYDITKGTA